MLFRVCFALVTSSFAVTVISQWKCLYDVTLIFPILSLLCEVARWPLTEKQPPTITTGFFHFAISF
uniref:Uncharacterized protein n=1 Tax=Strigamia maritima TaxID=126957 RepID=T1JJ87_STRMM